MCRPGITIAGPDTITATSLPDLAQRITLARDAEIREASSVAVTYDGWKGGDEARQGGWHRLPLAQQGVGATSRST